MVDIAKVVHSFDFLMDCMQAFSSQLLWLHPNTMAMELYTQKYIRSLVFSPIIQQYHLHLQLINVPNATHTLAVTTETVCAWRGGSVMARRARLKMEEDVSRQPLCFIINFQIFNTGVLINTDEKRGGMLSVARCFNMS